jgi:hypothetical protein
MPVGASFPALKVRYYRRMKQSRVYPFTVAWGDKPKPFGTVKNVTVRLLGAGAQIVPSEQALDATRPDLKATFFVTPLAYGWLRAQRIEVVVQGRKVQEIPLASKVVCQCWAGFWFILAIALPLALMWLRSTDPQWFAGVIRDNTPALPAIVAEQAPAVSDFWTAACAWKADTIERFCRFNHDNLLAAPVGVGLLLLSLWSLFTHRDRTTARWSEPVAVPNEV